jgi:hypothetical protein
MRALLINGEAVVADGDDLASFELLRGDREAFGWSVDLIYLDGQDPGPGTAVEGLTFQSRASTARRALRPGPSKLRERRNANGYVEARPKGREADPLTH